MARLASISLLAILALASCAGGSVQPYSALDGQQPAQKENGKPDISVAEFKKIPPFPPGHVSAQPSQSGVLITWNTNTLDPTLSYKVYRITQESAIPIAQVRGGIFIDKTPPQGSVHYAVSTINQYNLEGAKSAPIAVPK